MVHCCAGRIHSTEEKKKVFLQHFSLTGDGHYYVLWEHIRPSSAHSSTKGTPNHDGILVLHCGVKVMGVEGADVGGVTKFLVLFGPTLEV